MVQDKMNKIYIKVNAAETNKVCAVLACTCLLDVSKGQGKEEGSFIEQINNNVCTHTPPKKDSHQ